MMKRLIAITLGLILVISCGTTAFAAETSVSLTLEEIFEEAKTEYQVAAYANSNVYRDTIIHEEIELEDGNKIIVEGYPTNHIASGTLLEEGKEVQSYIYSATLVNQDEFSGKWGYLLSTIKYLKGTYTHSGTTFTSKKIDSFSYEMELNSGYSMSTMKIRYFSYDNYTGLAVDKTISTSQLIMTNYPTTSLGYVADNAGSGGLFNTGVQYSPVINGTTYNFQHKLIG